MKRLLTLLAGLIMISNLFAQSTTVLPPYKKFKSFPPIKLLLADSSTHFTKANISKKDGILLMLFNPECSHCRAETDSILKYIHQFKNTRIIMATTMPFEQMITFIKEFKLNKYPSITVGRDEHFFLPVYFEISYLPFLAFYDKKKNLISVFEGNMKVNDILAELKM